MQRRAPGTGYGSIQERLAAQVRFQSRHRQRDALAERIAKSGAQRVVIGGGPRRGKSELAKKLLREGATHHHGEELVGLEWSEGSELASRWFDEPGPFVCENVAAPRALRKWLARNPTGKPAEVVVHLGHAVTETTGRQEGMATGCDTVWKEIRSELIQRGVEVIES